jgi:hypothetical protein
MHLKIGRCDTARNFFAKKLKLEVKAAFETGEHTLTFVTTGGGNWHSGLVAGWQGMCWPFNT